MKDLFRSHVRAEDARAIVQAGDRPPAESEPVAPEPDFYTAGARLLGRGWDPGDDLARVVLQREALLAALAVVSATPRDDDAILRAVRIADRDGIVEAIRTAALVSWADANLQVGFDVPAALWQAELQNALSAEIAKDPQAVLDGLVDVDDPYDDARSIRAEAAGYIQDGLRVVGPQGRPVAARPIVRAHGDQLPRIIRPLPSRAPARTA